MAPAAEGMALFVVFVTCCTQGPLIHSMLAGTARPLQLGMLNPLEKQACALVSSCSYCCWKALWVGRPEPANCKLGKGVKRDLRQKAEALPAAVFSPGGM